MRYKDIIGQKFGDLVVIGHSDRTNAKQQAFWLCRCGCGRTIEVRGDNLRCGITKECTVCGRRGRTSVFVDGVVIDNGSV